MPLVSTLLDATNHVFGVLPAKSVQTQMVQASKIAPRDSTQKQVCAHVLQYTFLAAFIIKVM